MLKKNTKKLVFNPFMDVGRYVRISRKKSARFINNSGNKIIYVITKIPNRKHVKSKGGYIDITNKNIEGGITLEDDIIVIRQGVLLPDNNRVQKINNITGLSDISFFRKEIDINNIVTYHGLELHRRLERGKSYPIIDEDFYNRNIIKYTEEEFKLFTSNVNETVSESSNINSNINVNSNFNTDTKSLATAIYNQGSSLNIDKKLKRHDKLKNDITSMINCRPIYYQGNNDIIKNLKIFSKLNYIQLDHKRFEYGNYYKSNYELDIVIHPDHTTDNCYCSGPDTSHFACSLKHKNENVSNYHVSWEMGNILVCSTEHCNNTFGIYYFKHHCRGCGRYICTECCVKRDLYSKKQIFCFVCHKIYDEMKNVYNSHCSDISDVTTYPESIITEKEAIVNNSEFKKDVARADDQYLTNLDNNSDQDAKSDSDYDFNEERDDCITDSKSTLSKSKDSISSLSDYIRSRNRKSALFLNYTSYPIVTVVSQEPNIKVKEYKIQIGTNIKGQVDIEYYFLRNRLNVLFPSKLTNVNERLQNMQLSYQKIKMLRNEEYISFFRYDPQNDNYVLLMGNFAIKRGAEYNDLLTKDYNMQSGIMTLNANEFKEKYGFKRLYNN